MLNLKNNFIMRTITSILFVLVANTFIFAQFKGKVTDKKGEPIFPRKTEHFPLTQKPKIVTLKSVL